MVEFGTSSTFRGGFGLGFWVIWFWSCGVRGRKVKSRDCALASDLVRAPRHTSPFLRGRQLRDTDMNVTDIIFTDVIHANSKASNAQRASNVRDYYVRLCSM